MGDEPTKGGGVNFTAIGWFTLAKLRKAVTPDLYAALREAIRFNEIAFTHVGDEYLLTPEDYLAWRRRTRDDRSQGAA